MAESGIVDLAVIGGGVNGTGIARDAAGRGLSVVLCEKGDLAEGTSSRSGKLIHGGLRYLEYYEFRLVREALIEREVLLAAAPAHRLADALRAAALARAAPGLARALGPVPLRPSRRPQETCRRRAASISRSAPEGKPLKTAVQARLRIFRLLGGRCPPRRPQCRRRARARRGDPRPHRLHRRARARAASGASC